MRKYNVGDKVICLKYEINYGTTLALEASKGKSVTRYENSVNANYFGRKAIITKTYKQVMEEHRADYGNDVEFEDLGEYEIKFLDNGHTLAWVTDDELIPLIYMEMECDTGLEVKA